MGGEGVVINSGLTFGGMCPATIQQTDCQPALTLEYLPALTQNEPGRVRKYYYDLTFGGSSTDEAVFSAFLMFNQIMDDPSTSWREAYVSLRNALTLAWKKGSILAMSRVCLSPWIDFILVDWKLQLSYVLTENKT